MKTFLAIKHLDSVSDRKAMKHVFRVHIYFTNPGWSASPSLTSFNFLAHNVSVYVVNTNFEMQYVVYEISKLSHVWVLWKALLKGYVFSLPVF